MPVEKEIPLVLVFVTKCAKVIVKGTNLGECTTEKTGIEVHCCCANQGYKISLIAKGHLRDKHMFH